MNTLIGIMRKRFILILINMTINGDDKSKDDYDKMIEEISKNLVPIRPDRKNPRNRYKGYNNSADFCYRKLNKNDMVFINGRIENDMTINIKSIKNY